MATESSDAAGSPPSSSKPLQGRVAIVTGSSRGIGRTIALHLASLGAKVVVNYNSNAAEAEAVAAQINSSSSSSPNSAIVVGGDVSDPSHVKLLFDSAEEAFGAPVHIMVNNAAIGDPTRSTLADLPLDTFDRIFSVNARGSFLCCKEAANRIKRGGGGRIIMLSSSLTASLRPTTGVYAASKAAVEAMTKILAKELKGTLITVNCVAPGPVATDLFFNGSNEERIQASISACPHGRLGQTEDIAPIVGFLASDSSEWINGQTIRVNGGYI